MIKAEGGDLLDAFMIIGILIVYIAVIVGIIVIVNVLLRDERRKNRSTNIPTQAVRSSVRYQHCTFPAHPNVDLMSPIEYEKYVANLMRSKGFIYVQTTRASGDFGADILMTARSGVKICIQCKRHRKPVGYKAVQEVYSAKAYYGCNEAWVCSTHGFTRNAQQGAGRLGVKLYTIR